MLIRIQIMATLCLSFALLSTAHATKLPNPMPDTVSMIKPMLNSDRINYFFGNYGVEQIKACSTSFNGSRISNLYSKHDDEKVTRTLAIVEFATPIPEPLKPIHLKILKGASIGSTLHNDDWFVIKEPLYYGRIDLSPAVLNMMQVNDDKQGAISIYQLKVKRSDHHEIFDYCQIIEIYSPDYLTLSWLEAIDKNSFNKLNSMNLKTQPLLKKIRSCLTEL